MLVEFRQGQELHKEGFSLDTGHSFGPREEDK